MSSRAEKPTGQCALAIATIATVALLLQADAAAADLTVRVVTPAGQPVADAVISIESPAALAAPRVPQAVVDQKGKEFVPLVSAVQVGAAVDFPNSDNIRHQVYSFSPAKTFNIKLYANRPAAPIVFDRPGTVILGCNIHDQMVAWVRVVPTPWFAVTGADGTVTIAGVAPGRHALHVWHPSLAEEPEAVAVTLQDTAPAKVSRVIDAAPVASLRGASAPAGDPGRALP